MHFVVTKAAKLLSMNTLHKQVTNKQASCVSDMEWVSLESDGCNRFLYYCFDLQLVSVGLT
jgi:hypothetical protein